MCVCLHTYEHMCMYLCVYLCVCLLLMLLLILNEAVFINEAGTTTFQLMYVAFAVDVFGECNLSNKVHC